MVGSSEKESLAAEDVENLVQAIADCKLTGPPKIFYISNHGAALAPDKRVARENQELLDALNSHDICLIPTSELFKAVCYLLGRHNDDSLDLFKVSLRKDILDCEGIYALNEKKYYAHI